MTLLIALGQVVGGRTGWIHCHALETALVRARASLSSQAPDRVRPWNFVMDICRGLFCNLRLLCASHASVSNCVIVGLPAAARPNGSPVSHVLYPGHAVHSSVPGVIMAPLPVQVPVLVTANAGRLIKQAAMNCLPRRTMELSVHTCKHLSTPDAGAYEGRYSSPKLKYATGCILANF